ncbi:MAG: metal ABC transporter permease [Thermodesulfobacteriota bacterium]
MNLIETLNYPFMQHALVGVLFAGISFPLIGVFILSLNLIPLRFAMMHVALLGGAVGLFFGMDPLVPGLLFCGLASLGLGPISERARLGLGTVSGYFMTLTLALSFILFYKGDIHVLQAFNILWGNVLSLTRTDVVMVVVLSVVILGLVILFFKEVQAVLYDREVALAVGIPEKALYYAIVFVLGLSIAVSMRMIGALLIDAFLLLPAMAATLISRSLRQMFLFSSLFGMVSGLSGLYLSFALDIPTSSCIILAGSAVILACFLFGRKVRSRAPSQ